MKRRRRSVSLVTVVLIMATALILQGCTNGSSRNKASKKDKVIDYAYIEVVGNGDINLTYKVTDEDIYVPISRWNDGSASGNMIWVFDGDKRYLCLRYPLYDEQMNDDFYEKMLIEIGKQDLERIYDKKHMWSRQEKKWFIANNYKTNYDDYDTLDRKKDVLERDMQNKRMLSKNSNDHEIGRFVDMLRFNNSSTSKDQEHEVSESKQDEVDRKTNEDDTLQQEKTDLLREKLQIRKERLELEQLKKELEAKNVNNKKDLN